MAGAVGGADDEEAGVLGGAAALHAETTRSRTREANRDIHGMLPVVTARTNGSIVRGSG
jgi:hypothetical protein